MGDGLHHAHIQAKGVFDNLLAVAGGGGGADVNVRVFLVELLEEVPHQGHRVAGVGQVAGEEYLLLGVDRHGLHRGGAGVDAHVGHLVLQQGSVGGDAVLLVAQEELLILLLVVEEGGAALVVVAGAVVGNAVRNLRQVELLAGMGEGRARRHIVQGIFRAQALHAQNAVKGRPQLGEEGQRPAQVHHLALNLPALGQARDGLVHHGGEDALGDVVFLGALVQKRLDVGLGEHAAPGGDAVGALALPGDGVQLLGGDGKQCGHLVDKGPGAAGAGAVHAHLHRAGQEQDFCVLAPQLNDHVGVGDVFLHSGAGGVHLLHKGDVQVLCQAHARRAGHAQAGPLCLGELLLDAGEHAGGLLGNLGEVPLVFLVDGLVLPVVDHTFQGGGAHVQTDFHSSFYHPFQSRGSFSCDGWGGCRGCMIANPTKIKSYPGFLTMFLKFSENKNCCIAVLNHTSIFRRKNQHFRRANLWKLRKKVCARRGFHADTFPVPFWASCAIL